MSLVHVLVADDFKAWRSEIRSILEVRPELRVVSEVSDGLTAVQKSEELQPELILLDVNLPELNGIEAARRMRKLAPGSRILILSQESDPDVVQEALNSGALGYIYKSQMQRELLPAIESVLAGRQFVGSGLKGYKLRAGTQAQGSHRHDIVFYSNDATCVDILADFTIKALRAGKTAVVVATKPHREGFLQKVRADYADVNIDTVIQQGACIILDSGETLRATTLNGLPDRGGLFDKVGGLIESVRKGSGSQRHSVAVCGECSPLLWTEGKKEAAIEFEHLSDELTKMYGIELLCTHPLSSYQGKGNEEGLKRMCAEHMAVYFE